MNIGDQTYESVGVMLSDLSRWLLARLWRIVNELIPAAILSYFSPKVAINQM